MHKYILNNIILLMELGGGDPAEFARVLMSERQLPIYYGYTFSCTASEWLKASSKEAYPRKHYEADAWERLKLNDLVANSSSSVVGVVGLATGEGLGEIELLRRVLADGYTVHYLAIDLSPVLLVAHIETIREVFDQELKEGRLLCASVLVDVFSQIDKAVAQARAKFVSSGILLREDEFLPQSCSMIATYLGNCLGNDAPDRENYIFASISKAFPTNRPLAILAGVSVVREVDGNYEPDVYTRSFDEFLLQTPHHLLKNIEILRSVKPRESHHLWDEFVLPDEEPGEDFDMKRECRLRRTPQVVPRPYSASHGIEGHIYRFYYRLDFDLEMPRKKLRIPGGTEIALYTIIKYNMKTLIEAIQKRRFKVLYDEDYHLPIKMSGVEREYAVFVAYLEDPEST